MLLCELFEPDSLTDQLRQAALDYLTPLLGENVPFVTVDQMIEALRHSNFGVVINQPLIMELLNPDEVEAVSKIEGDKIFLATPDAIEQERAVSAEDAEKDQEHVQDMAQDQAQQNMQQEPVAPEAAPEVAPEAPAAPATSAAPAAPAAPEAEPPPVKKPPRPVKG
jgi:hypothetical protein